MHPEALKTFIETYWEREKQHVRDMDRLRNQIRMNAIWMSLANLAFWLALIVVYLVLENK